MKKLNVAMGLLLLALLLPPILAGIGVYVALGPVTFWERYAAGILSVIVGFIIGIVGIIIIIAASK